jgi:hypothetical protein
MKTKKTLDTGWGVARVAMLLAVGGALVLGNACAGGRPAHGQIDDGCVTATLAIEHTDKLAASS